jgi:ABC-2 type transport system ATP-binding protein
VERFSRNKVISLQFSGTEVPADLSAYGNVFDVQAPRAKLAVPREKVAEVLGSVLARYAVDDVGVLERPLEEVIAEFFTQPQEQVAASA